MNVHYDTKWLFIHLSDFIDVSLSNIGGSQRTYITIILSNQDTRINVLSWLLWRVYQTTKVEGHGLFINQRNNNEKLFCTQVSMRSNYYASNESDPVQRDS